MGSEASASPSKLASCGCSNATGPSCGGQSRAISYPGSYVHKVAVSATIRAVRRASARSEEPLPDERQPTGMHAAQALQTSPGESPEALAERAEQLRTL